jgi:hypothetical protein
VGGAGTVAVLTATVTRLATLERLLLAIGGRAWVRSLFVATLERLAAELSAGRATGQAVVLGVGPA